ncbi:hypothetical protein ACLB2K_041892 [Fragaria x ananassa]
MFAPSFVNLKSSASAALPPPRHRQGRRMRPHFQPLSSSTSTTSPVTSAADEMGRKTKVKFGHVPRLRCSEAVPQDDRISGIGGSGKTTLVKELVKDDHVRSYFGERILFLTVSQSPDVDDLKAKILGFIMGGQVLSPTSVLPQMNFQFEWKNPTKTLVVLDDVWSLSTLQPLLFNIPGCKTLVVSRVKFPTAVKATYDVELLGEDEAVSLFCHSAFGQKSIPAGADRKLVKQIVDECKRLPLALKVIGSSLRDQPEMIRANASKRLSRGESIGELHETDLLDRMAISVNCLSPKVRECFLDLGAFPEDKKIPLDVLINIWVETHDHIDEELAFAILNELADKNLVTLVKDARDGDIYSSC